jgi:molybdopterin synthase sulfur carrier subunit
MPLVWIPTQFQRFTGGQSQVKVEGATVRQVIDNLEVAFPGIRERLVEEGRIRPEIAVAVDSEITTEGLRARVKPESEVTFLPAIAGG